uniref:Chromosome X open reading frame 58 n=1 Tax=Otolemur garnettii TaxID=30611 RepID=H0WJR4_OTOGA
MNHFVNRPSTAVGKLGNELFGKEHKVYLAKDAKAKLTQRRRRDISARTIQRAWLAHTNRALFKLLKHTVCAAEYYVTYEILKKVSPVEANLLKDPSMKYKVRFRFSGETFPPFIVFKIFLHTEGHGYKYFSGKKSLKSSNKAGVDAYKTMGIKKFYHQVIEDECIFQKFGITEEIDIVTMQDFMQYSSLLDETPALSGGRNNYWRKLSLEDIPRTMIMHDIIDYAESKVISNRLRKEMKYLLQRPRTEEMRQHQLQIVSEIRYPSFSITQPLYRSWRQQSQVKHLGRRSKKAQMKVEKMKKAYLAKEKNASTVTEVISRCKATTDNNHLHPIF